MSGNRTRHLAFVSIISLCISTGYLIGCTGASIGPNGPAATVTSVTPACTPNALVTGQTSQCTAAVNGTGSFSTGVAWSADSGSINSAGLYAAPVSVPVSGYATVTATSTSDSSKTGVTKIALSVPPSVASVSVSCSPATVQPGQSAKCTAAVSGAGNYNPLVTWSVDSGSIDQSGTFMPPGFATTATVKAASVQDPSRFATATITVGISTGLNLSIIDLPASVAGNVTLLDTNGHSTSVTSSETLSLAAGTYSLKASSVVSGGSTYYATTPTQTIIIPANGISTATVDYYNVIPNTTKMLDVTGSAGLSVSPDGATLTLPNTSQVAASLQPNDVLVVGITAATPHGLLKKIASVASTGSSIVVSTTPAALSDEIHRARFTTNLIVVKGMSKIGPIASTARPQPMVLSSPCANATHLLTLPFNQSLPPDANQNTLSVNGELDFCNLTISFSYSFLDLFASVSVGIQEYGKVVVQGEYATSFSTNVPLSLQDLEANVVCLGNQDCTAVSGLSDSVGNAALVVTPVITPFVTISGSAAGAVYIGGDQSATLQAGIQVSNFIPSPIAGAVNQQEAFPVGIDGQATVKGAFGVTIGLELLGSVTVHVDPAVYTTITANTNANPWWTVDVGAQADAGLTASFFGFGSKDFDTSEFTLFDVPVTQASGGFVPQPTLASVSPTAVVQGSSSSIIVQGANFVPGSAINIAGVSVPTSFTDPTSMMASIPANMFASAGIVPVTVVDQASSGATSNSQPLSVVCPASPTVTITPSSVSLVESASQAFSVNSCAGLVTWTVAEGPNGGSVSSKGYYTAPKVTGTFHIVATSISNPKLTGSVTVTVTAGPSIPAGSAMFGVNPQRTNSTSASGPSSKPTFSAIAYGIAGSLRRISSDGTIIITSPGICSGGACGIVSAYTAAGSLKWTVQLTLADSQGFSDVAISPTGTVYVSSYYSTAVFALNASTGSTIWKTSVPSSGNESGDLMIDSFGTIYLQTSSSVAPAPSPLLVALNPDGTVKWSSNVNTRAYNHSVLSADGSLIYLEGSQGSPYNYGQADAYLSPTGVLASYNNCTTNTIYAAGGGYVIGLLTNNHLAVLPPDLSTCTDLQLGSQAIVADSFQALTGQGTLVASLNNVFTGYSFNGAALWSSTFPMGGGIADNNGVLFEDVLAPGSSSSDIVAVNGNTGALVWRTTLPSPVYSGNLTTPIAMGPDGSLYVLTGQTLYRAQP